MKTAFMFTVIFITAVGMLISVINMIPAPEYRVYDCSMAEFHPDFPKEVKEECRRIRSAKIIHT